MRAQFTFVFKCAPFWVLLSSVVICEDVRIKRQSGYVYNRPSISFDLPSRATAAPTAGTQAPTVDRARGQGAQQMFYAYPAPAGGSVNIGAVESCAICSSITERSRRWVFTPEAVSPVSSPAWPTFIAYTITSNFWIFATILNAWFSNTRHCVYSSCDILAACSL
ncbi:hypothetical protein MSG28_008177, partial [Choristoneura fumiferana]